VKPLLNSKAVCEWLGVSPATLSRMVRRGKIPYVLLGSGKTKLIVRFRESDLEAWLTRRSHGTGGRQNLNGYGMATKNQNPAQTLEMKSVTPVPQTGR
jgi:excisionase family DNA binding protein